MAKKKLSLNNLKAQKLSKKDQLQTKGGVWDYSNRIRKNGESVGVSLMPHTIIDDTIDIRLKGDDGECKGGF